MPSRNEPSTQGLRAAVSVVQMARALGMSRASFYAHVRKGTFLAPIYSLSTRRPVYTAEMQARNLEVRATQVGVNGEFVLFYERASRSEVVRPTRQPSSRRSERQPDRAAELRGRLEGLGLNGLGDAQVRDALDACFPHGTAEVAEADILRVVYRHLRRSMSA